MTVAQVRWTETINRGVRFNFDIPGLDMRGERGLAVQNWLDATEIEGLDIIGMPLSTGGTRLRCTLHPEARHNGGAINSLVNALAEHAKVTDLTFVDAGRSISREGWLNLIPPQQKRS